MSFFTRLAALFTVVSVAGCDTGKTEIEKGSVVYALPGTSTAVVGIGLDKHGMPFLEPKEIILHPGQKVIFAGPDKFVIIFKNKKTPNKKIDNVSVDGVVVIDVPDKIMEQREFSEEVGKSGELRFSYGVRVNDKELDPDIIVRRR